MIYCIDGEALVCVVTFVASGFSCWEERSTLYLKRVNSIETVLRAGLTIYIHGVCSLRGVYANCSSVKFQVPSEVIRS